MRRRDLSGARFGMLHAVLDRSSKEGGVYRYRWLCRCDCGVEKEVDTQHLLSGSVVSCGCSKRTRGGATAHPGYQSWHNMMRRCYDATDKQFKDYGGRGLLVCERWKHPENFFQDMWPRPTGMTLERVDNDLGYSPENCVWASRAVQASNKRNVRLYLFNGERRSVAQIAREVGMPVETLRSRLKAGVPLEQAARNSGGNK